MSPYVLAALLAAVLLAIARLILVLFRRSREGDPGRVSPGWLTRQGNDERKR